MGSTGLFRASLGELQSSECISGVISEQNVFSSSNLVDFVLEPDVYIYLADQQGIQFIGFDQQTNGSIAASNLAQLESYGDAIITIFNSVFVRFCNATTVECDSSVIIYMNLEYPDINDILTFRKSKQPLPGTLTLMYTTFWDVACIIIVHCKCTCMYTPFATAPPSHPTDVRVFTGSSTAVISWMRPSFVVDFFGVWILRNESFGRKICFYYNIIHVCVHFLASVFLPSHLSCIYITYIILQEKLLMTAGHTV